METDGFRRYYNGLARINPAHENIRNSDSKKPLTHWERGFNFGMSTTEQNQSQGRRKISPLEVMPYAVLRVVPVVHRREGS